MQHSSQQDQPKSISYALVSITCFRVCDLCNWFAWIKIKVVKSSHRMSNSPIKQTQVNLLAHYNDVIMSSDDVLNHQPHDCLLNRLFKALIKENIKALRPFDDVIMSCRYRIHLGLYSLSGQTSYQKISWSLEIRVEYFPIALKFNRHLGSSAAKPNACQTSERYDHYNIQSRGFETSRDLALRRLTA